MSPTVTAADSARVVRLAHRPRGGDWRLSDTQTTRNALTCDDGSRRGTGRTLATRVPDSHILVTERDTWRVSRRVTTPDSGRLT
jgi:hypothetical protein